MADAKMVRLAAVGRFKLYYANRSTFVEPGLHLWTGQRHRRVIPLPRA